MQEFFIFECTVCKEKNYTSLKNKKKHPDKLERMKFCKRCRKRTKHKETK
jgi:large subunit ribosomal protein L33